MAMPHSGLFAEDWNHAIESYNHSTGRDLRKEIGLKGLNSTDDLTLKIHSAHKSFEGFRAKESKLKQCLKTALRPVQFFSQILQAATALSPIAPASIVLGSVLFLVNSAEGVSNAYDSICELFKSLEEITARLEVYQEVLVHLKLQKILVIIVGLMLRIIGGSEKLIKRGRLTEYFIVMILGKDDVIEELMNELQRSVESERSMVLALMSAATERLERGVGWVARNLEGSLQRSAAEKEKALLERTLRTVTYDKVYDRQRELERSRLDGIGQWLFDQSLFRSWYDHEFPLLWLVGIRGSGKSFLSSCVISELERRHPQFQGAYPPTSVAYFYIKEDNEVLQSSNTWLKTIAYQITKNDKLFERHASAVCADPDNLRITEDTWSILLDRFFLSQGGDNSAVIIIDALDEAPFEERERFWKILRTAKFTKTHSGHLRLRFLLVGRSERLETEVYTYWGRRSHPMIEVAAQKNSRDIESYIEKMLPRVRNLKNPLISKEKRIELRDKIRTTLKDGAMGTFLWVRLVFETIRDQSRVSDIEQTLQMAPRELFALIRYIITRLAAGRNRRKDDLNELLLWVTFARREMLLGECRLLLKLKPPLNDGMLDLEDVLRGPYSSFFQLIRKDGKTTEDLQKKYILKDAIEAGEDADVSDDNLDELDELDELDRAENGTEITAVDLKPNSRTTTPGSDISNTTVQFTHARIRDYLLQADMVDGIGVEPNKAHLHIVIICLESLTDEIPKVDDKAWEEPGLVAYAANYFLDHLADIEITEVAGLEKLRIARLLYLLLTRSNSIERWFLYYSKKHYLSDALIYHAENIVSIRSWLQHPEFQATLTESQRESFREMMESASQLLRPIARVLARSWLYLDYSPEEALGFLHPYCHLVSSETIGGGGPSVTISGRKTIKKLSPNEIMSAAMCIELEKSSRWHHSVGTTLGDTGHFEAARAEFHESLSLVPTPWALYGLAVTYELSGQYRLAVKNAVAAVEVYQSVETASNGSSNNSSCSSDNEEDGNNESQYKRSDLENDESEVNTDTSWVKTAKEDSEECQVAVPKDRREDIKCMEGSKGDEDFEEPVEASKPAEPSKLSDTYDITPATQSVVPDDEPSLLKLSDRWDPAAVWANICTWRTRIGDAEGSREAAWKAFEERPTDMYYMMLLLRVLYNQSLQVEWVDVALKFHEQVSAVDPNISMLQEYMILNHGYLRTIRAFAAVGRIDELKCILENAIQSTPGTLPRNFTLWHKSALARLLFQYSKNRSEAIAMWENVVDTTVNLERPTSEIIALQYAVTGLSQNLFWDVDTSKVSEEKACKFVEKVESVVSIQPEWQTKKIAIFEMTYLPTCWASWYRSRGLNEKAKVYLRSGVLEAVGMLSDDTLENDRDGWESLSRLLMHAGDDANAAAACGVLAMSIDRLREIRKAAQELTGHRCPTMGVVPEIGTELMVEDRLFEVTVICDGPCRRPREDWETLHRCRYCPNLDFCDECFELLQTGKFPYNICNPNHSFFQAYPIALDITALAAHKVNGVTVARKEWLDEIRRQWQD